MKWFQGMREYVELSQDTTTVEMYMTDSVEMLLDIDSNVQLDPLEENVELSHLDSSVEQIEPLEREFVEQFLLTEYVKTNLVEEHVDKFRIMIVFAKMFPGDNVIGFHQDKIVTENILVTTESVEM